EEFNFSNIDEMKLRLKNKFDALCKVIVEKKEKNSDEFDKSILKYIDQSYTDSSLSLSTLSELFNLSESHLSRSFKEKFGVNYLDYVNKKRVEYALNLLKNSDNDINEIAQKAGFNNDVTFRRLFKKYYGTSPLKYKEAFLKGDA
ncbi:MAG: helix-turn-helix transcriptional regulator, partial [Clostridiales bacterium]|nr:helix-turn-helix transcriptional regulator [Clostridiales bacterium]